MPAVNANSLCEASDEERYKTSNEVSVAPIAPNQQEEILHFAADELIPESYEYIAPGMVRVSLKTRSGVPLVYTMTFSMLVQSVNLAVKLMSSHTAQVFKDLDVF